MENTTGTTTTVLNKILIPVITTVLGATAIYFLGFNKKGGGRSDMETLLITKEATIKAWKSFVSSSNIGYKNTMSLTEEYTKKLTEEARQGFESMVPVMKDYREELFRESKKLVQDMEGILKKEEDIDHDFASMINRALDNQKDQDKKISVFFDNLISLAKSDLSIQEKAEKWQKEAEKIIVAGERTDERAANEAEGIAKILSEKYGQTFDLNELLVYVDYTKGKDKKNTKDHNDPAPPDPDAGGGVEVKDPEVKPGNDVSNEAVPTASLLTGEWEMTNGALELSKNGDMFWTFENKGYTSGTWKLQDGKLQMNATNPDNGKKSVLIGFLSNVTQNSFTMTFMTSPKEVYHFKRTN